MALAHQFGNNEVVVTGRKARRQLEKKKKKQQAGAVSAEDRKAQEIDALWRKGAQEVSNQRLVAAEKTYRQVVALEPNHAMAYFAIGTLTEIHKRASDAYPYFVRAAELAPNDAAIMDGLGKCLNAMGMFDAAVVAFSRAIAARPFDAGFYVRLARSHFGAGDNKAAIAGFKKALELEPENLDAKFELGNQHEVEGRFDLARKCYDEVLALDAGRFDVHLRLASMGDAPLEEQEKVLERLDEVLASDDLSPEVRSRFLFAGAKINQRQKRYDQAFDQFTRANALAGKDDPFDREGLVSWMDRMKSSYSRDVFEQQRAAGVDTEQPIFIVGMPRSGTTLTEQIVSSHPLVEGAGELRKMDQLASTMAAIRDADLCYPEDIGKIAPERLAAVGEDYLSVLRQDSRGEAKRITDKYVFNFCHVGLISILFPKARIIHCRRDPMDTSLSCFFQNFAGKMAFPFWHNLEDIGFFYRQYEKLMAHWQEVLPKGRILEVQYEDTVADQEAASRRIIDFVGLEWDDACIRFYENKRAVSTASVWQVRQKVYNSSVERWRVYDEHLGPLKRELARED